MRRIIALTEALLIIFLFCACGSAPQIVESTVPPLPTPLVYHEEENTRKKDAVTLAAADLNDSVLRLLEASSLGENTIVSGASIASLLCYFAADADEETLVAYQTLWQRSGLTAIDAESSIHTLRDIYTDAGFSLSQFLVLGEGPVVSIDTLSRWKSYSAAEVSMVDFTNDVSVSALNDAFFDADAQQNTPFEVTEEPTNTVLAETLSGELTWQCGFDPVNTCKATFTPLTGNASSVAMMHARLSVEYLKDSGFSMAVLPASSGLEAWIILPDSGTDPSLVLSSLTSSKLSSLREAASVHDVNMSLPRMSLAGENDMRKPMEALGASLLFSESASYSNLGSDIRFSQVYQSVSLSFTEAGETVSSTVGSSHELSPDPDLITDMNCDHPFLFLLVDSETGGILVGAFVADTSWMQFM